MEGENWMIFRYFLKSNENVNLEMLRFAPQGDVAPRERSAVVEPFQVAIRTSVLLRWRLVLAPRNRGSSRVVVVDLKSLRTCELGKNCWLGELGEIWGRRKGKESSARSGDARAWRNTSSC